MKDKFNLLSEEQLAAISSGKLWTFHGGVHPQENKQQSNQSVIRDAGIPSILIIPVEYKGHAPELLVKVGDPVLKGQPLSKVYGAMVVQHASSSGQVIAIENHTDLHPSGLPVLCVVIKTDGLDRSINYQGCQDYLNKPVACFIEAIQNAGIIGLGGAGFPTHLKLIHSQHIKLLIINGAECEPYITSDDRLMQEHAQEIIQGIEILDYVLNPELIVIAIEDNKQAAIIALEQALKMMGKSNVIIRQIPTIYPSGSAKQLIKIITGAETPLAQHSSELGIVMLNVGTTFAIKEAILDGKPLTSRIVTITGGAFQKQLNLSVRLGTPLAYLMDKYNFTPEDASKIIIGGPMMGFTITDKQAPVTKICNCILAPTKREMPSASIESPCIRCSECADVCPANLLPQQLLWYSKSQEHDKLNDYNLSACIECGACAFVCPSHIPLVEYYRISKAEISSAKEEAQKAEVARIRHENREARLVQAKLDRQAKHKAAAEKRKAQMKEKNDAEEKSSVDVDYQVEKIKPAKKNDAVAAAIARAKAKKVALTKGQDNDQEKTETVDPKKAAIAAAIARAKAKKAALAKGNDNDNDNDKQKTETVDPKKAAIAAAIARAKAKKAAIAKGNDNDEDKEKKEAVEVDPKKVAVAAAVARAKAKKAENAAPDNKAVIEARKQRKEEARLHKQEKEQQASQPEVVTEKAQSAADMKKAKIAAAIARAKAKKANAAKKNKNEEQS